MFDIRTSSAADLDKLNERSGKKKHSKVIELEVVSKMDEPEAEDIRELNEITTQLGVILKPGFDLVIKAGEILLRCQTRHKKGKYGTWLSWLKENTNISDKTANRWIALYKNRAQLDKLSNQGNLTDAYRIILPNPKKKANKPKSLEVNLSGKEHGIIKDALSSWRVFKSASSEEVQGDRVVCFKCKTWFAGAQKVFLGGGRGSNKDFGRLRFFQCKCENSERVLEVES